MNKRPTKKQRELFEFIQNFIQERGYGPSYREIMRSLDYKSVSTVAIHVDNLIALGYLAKTNRSARSLEVTHGAVPEDVEADRITPTQEKWLVDIVSGKFKEAENGKTKPSQAQIDDLFVLVGALSVLGFSEAAESFKAKLKHYR